MFERVLHPATRTSLATLLVLLVMAMVVLSVVPSGVAIAGEPGSEAVYVPDFTLPTHLGGEVKLSEVLKNGPVILDFWATWCAPCRLAMPIYVELAEQYADQGLRFLPVSVDTKKAQRKIGPWFKKHGWEFASLLDPQQKVASKLRILSLPTMFLVDQDRRIVATHIGFRPDMKERLAKEVQALLNSEGAETRASK
jgi:thiol-disulfide isomerase/thioredoxin